MKKLLIFDGNSILNRAFYGIKLLTNSRGEYTNGIYGFLNIYLKFFQEEEPDYVAVAFDLREKTFRHKMYDKYKAQRKGMPEELASQVQPLKDILNSMNVAILEKAGYEADDIIGTVSKQCEENNILCDIITGDKDDLQLASEKTTVRLVVTKGGNTSTTDYNGAAVFEKYGVTPKEFIDCKALMGDKSDNIPGVSGIGEKTAFSLISKYKSLDNLYNSVNELKGAQKQKILDGKEFAYLSYNLSEIDRNVPLDISLDDMVVKKYNGETLYGNLSELELKSLISRMGIESSGENKVSLKIISVERLTEFNTSEVFYDLFIYNEGFDFVYFAENNVYVRSYKNDFDILDDIGILKNLFEDKSVKKYSHGIKEHIVFLKRRYDIDYKGDIFDTKIAAYILEPSKNDYNLAATEEEYLRKKADKYETVGLIGELSHILDKKIQENKQEKLLYEVEFPLVFVLASMEISGFTVDRKMLLDFSQVLSVHIEKLKTMIYEEAGEEFNINSPKQMGVILFEKMKLPVVKKTKTGYSTNAEVLEKLAYTYDIARLITEYRTYSKLKSTYADGLYNAIDTQTNKIYSNFNQTVTATGRISSTEPNLQNIPVRLELGREIRKMFIASEGNMLVDADYSQIELRVLAHISGDDNMINAFKNNIDIHANTAAQVFNVDIENVSNMMRSKAKAVNFGIVYGIGEFSLAKDIKVSVREAGEYIKNYFEKYPKIKRYLDESVEYAKENGYAKTLLERRRYIPEIKSSNYNLRSFGERVAMNAPIQGYAADIIKIAMVRVCRRLENEKLKAKLILQVHDELIVDTPIGEIEKVKEILKNEMENAVKLSVPLKVDMKVGKSWFDTK